MIPIDQPYGAAVAAMPEQGRRIGRSCLRHPNAITIAPIRRIPFLIQRKGAGFCSALHPLRREQGHAIHPSRQQGRIVTRHRGRIHDPTASGHTSPSAYWEIHPRA